ncbi:MAG: LCP family protein [Anaerolineales bacterium]|nr:LCP family protein [Anaerolineales bacterium]MCB8954398.1 LCP family protein [Ardenticatenales bacterium]
MAPRSSRRPPPRIRLPLWGLALLVLLGIALLFGSAAWLYRTVQGMAASWDVTEPEFVVDGGNAGIQSPPDGNLPPPGITESDPALPVVNIDSQKPWSGHERVTILLLGIDQRCDDTGPTRTDTMMLLTVDPVGLSAATLSLPRDLWVEIPGFEVDRINQAYYLGEIYEYPGGGPALAVETVEATLGINVDFYVTVNFDAFVEIVDLIGGVDVHPPENIEDETYPDRCYGYDPFFLTAGEHHLDGQMALKYARTRATAQGDIDRAARQQEVVLAVRNKVLQLNMLPQLIPQTPRLWQTFQQNVRTNMSPDEAIQLALLIQNIPPDSLQTAVIDYNYVYPETTPDGQQVLVPIRDNIRDLRDRLFVPPAVPTPVIENLPALMAQEQARVSLLNGTTQFGLAGKTQAYLQSFNINVTEIGNADSADYRTTQIIDFGFHPHTTQYLTQLMSLPPLNVSTGTEAEGDYDVLVILGGDWNLPQP